MTTDLPLMKSVLTTLAKKILLLMGLSEGMSASDEAIQKMYQIYVKNLCIRNYNINNFKWRNIRYNENN